VIFQNKVIKYIELCLKLVCILYKGEGFRYFDFGDTGNLLRYGSAQPPEYNLSKVFVPVYIAGAELDPFAPPEVLMSLHLLGYYYVQQAIPI